MNSSLTVDLPRAIQSGALLHLPDHPTEEDRLAVYLAALATGLSDAEAREEGWPSIVAAIREQAEQEDRS